MPFHYNPRRRQERARRLSPPLMLAAATICVCLLVLPTAGAPLDPGPTSAGVPVTDAPPPAGLTPEPTPTPTPEPTPTPIHAFDFSQPAPQSDPVEMDYFSDALFIGDSRTDGLQLYSGIEGSTFYCYKGLTVFELGTRKVVDLPGGTYTVLEALERQPYAKIYISLGVNELGYGDDQGFADAFAEFLAQVKELQPGAVIYLENLVPVNPEKCKEYNQFYYVNNERVAAYNAIFPRLAEENRVVLLDVAAALSDDEGILPREATVDGVHFTRDWYKKWLEYLMCRTVDAAEYQAGQEAPAAQGVEEG